MINYIRRQVQEQPELANTKTYSLTGNEPFWNDDTLLQSVLEDDALLHGKAVIKKKKDIPRNNGAMVLTIILVFCTISF
jgi:hypothetical protein